MFPGKNKIGQSISPLGQRPSIHDCSIGRYTNPSSLSVLSDSIEENSRWHPYGCMGKASIILWTSGLARSQGQGLDRCIVCKLRRNTINVITGCISILNHIHKHGLHLMSAIIADYAIPGIQETYIYRNRYYKWVDAPRLLTT